MPNATVRHDETNILPGGTQLEVGVQQSIGIGLVLVRGVDHQKPARLQRDAGGEHPHILQLLVVGQGPAVERHRRPGAVVDLDPVRMPSVRQLEVMVIAREKLRDEQWALRIGLVDLVARSPLLGRIEVGIGGHRVVVEGVEQPDGALIALRCHEELVPAAIGRADGGQRVLRLDAVPPVVPVGRQQLVEVSPVLEGSPARARVETQSSAPSRQRHIHDPVSVKIARRKIPRPTPGVDLDRRPKTASPCVEIEKQLGVLRRRHRDVGVAVRVQIRRKNAPQRLRTRLQMHGRAKVPRTIAEKERHRPVEVAGHQIGIAVTVHIGRRKPLGALGKFRLRRGIAHLRTRTKGLKIVKQLRRGKRGKHGQQ